MRTFTETLAMAYMIFMVLLFVDIASGAAPIFYSAGYVEANGDSIDIGTGIAVPACGVWDMSGTGAWDLVLSDGVYGTTDPLRLYEATATPPVFSNYTTLMTLPNNTVHSMNIVDWGQPNTSYTYDGYPDLIINNFWYRRNGTYSFYPDCLTIADTSGNALYGTALCVGDWDGDGDQDILSGMNTEDGYTTTICLYRNIEDASSNFPVLAAPTVLAICTSFPAWSYPAMGDLDGDGDTDLLVATNNYIQFWRNDEGTLVHDGEVQSGPNTLKGVGVNDAYSNMRISLVDWEDDGDLDLITCDSDGQVNLWISYLSSYPNFPISVAREDGEVAYTALPELRVEQNPCVDGTLHLVLPETTGMETISLYSCDGRLVDEVRVEAGVESFTHDVSTYPTGVYFITMTNEMGMASTRVVVQ